MADTPDILTAAVAAAQGHRDSLKALKADALVDLAAVALGNAGYQDTMMRVGLIFDALPDDHPARPHYANFLQATANANAFTRQIIASRPKA